MRISGSNVGYTVFRGSVKGTGYPLHSPVSTFTSSPVRHRVSSHFDWSLTLGLDAGSQLQASGLEYLHPPDRRLGGPSYSARGKEKESLG